MAVDGTRIGITPIEGSVFHAIESARVFAESVRVADGNIPLLVDGFPGSTFVGFVTEQQISLDREIVANRPRLTPAEYVAARYLLEEAIQLAKLFNRPQVLGDLLELFKLRGGQGSPIDAIEGVNQFGSGLHTLAGLRDRLVRGVEVPDQAGYSRLVEGLRADGLQIGAMASLGLVEHINAPMRPYSFAEASVLVARNIVRPEGRLASYKAGARHAGSLYMRVHSIASRFVSPEYPRTSVSRSS